MIFLIVKSLKYEKIEEIHVGPRSLLQIIFAIQKYTGIFREKTKSRKALVSTFITTFVVANGVHKSIVDSEVTMDGLFGS